MVLVSVTNTRFLADLMLAIRLFLHKIKNHILKITFRKLAIR